MTIQQPDLALPLLNAILTNTGITSALPTYLTKSTIFTRRPVPPAAPYPMIVISPDIAKVHRDGFTDQRPVITRDIAVYGQNDTPEKYRLVEQVAYAIYDLFHNQIRSFVPPDGWCVSDVIANGPIPAPADDDLHVGRVVSLQITLAHLED